MTGVYWPCGEKICSLLKDKTDLREEAVFVYKLAPAILSAVLHSVSCLVAEPNWVIKGHAESILCWDFLMSSPHSKCSYQEPKSRHLVTEYGDGDEKELFQKFSVVSMVLEWVQLQVVLSLRCRM